jgi:hypothetical protein
MLFVKLPLSFIDLLSFFFRYLFLDPPGGYAITKKSFTLHATMTTVNRILASYRFRRSGRTVATALTGPRRGLASLRCRLLSSVLLISSWDFRIQSGITRTRISSWTVTPRLFARSFSFRNIPRSRTCMNFTDSLPSRICDQRPRTMKTRVGYTWLTYSS